MHLPQHAHSARKVQNHVEAMDKLRVSVVDLAQFINEKVMCSGVVLFLICRALTVILAPAKSTRGSP